MVNYLVDCLVSCLDKEWEGNRMNGFKVRGFSLDTNKMYSFDELCKSKISFKDIKDKFNAPMIYMLSSELKDKNGIEIYDGDIVKHNAYGGGISAVSFQRCQFSISVNGIILCIWNPDLSLEVIGNIYENPELS